MLVIKFVFPFLYESFLYHKVDKVVRLVKKKHLFTGDVHEKITRRRKYWNTKNFMIHYTYKGLTNLLQKDSYAWFQAKHL
jgi:hypothetical protein